MSRDITLLHPELQEIITKFLQACKNEGLIVKVTDTFRNKQEQNNLYAKGRTKPGNIVTWVKYPLSNHNWGIAFDFCRNDGQGAYNDKDNWFYKVGQVGKKFSLSWGGDWTPADRPHLEMTKYGDAKALSKKYTTFDKFKKTWTTSTKTNSLVDRTYKYNNKIETFKVINKDNENYVQIRDLANLLNKLVKYDNKTKITSFEDIIETKNVLVDDEEKTIKSINYGGYNYMNARDVADALNYEIENSEKENKIKFTKKE